MVTVAHPRSLRSPAASGEVQTTAPLPATAWPPLRREEPSKVIRGPRGHPRGPKSAASATAISCRSTSS
eukprot:812812-Alexandrium_andersonii.AAC.1